MSPAGRNAYAATFAVARKELVTSLRDRQTVIYTFILPICMYPVLFWVMVQGALLVQGKRERTEVHVGLALESLETAQPGLSGALASEGRAVDGEATRVVHVQRPAAPLDLAGARAWLASDAEEAPGGEESLDAVLFLPDPTSAPGGDAPRAQLFYDSTDSRSEIARGRVAQRLPPFAESLRAEKARARGRDPTELDPLDVEKHDIAPKRDKGAVMLSLILPMLLVVMAVLGAFFPAVDLTAGEKERNTMETTLLLPISRLAVHRGKILAVCTTAVIAMGLNLVAIGFSAEHLLSMLAKTASIQIELPILALFSIAPLAVLFAFFVSAVLTGIAGLAATFKEGQAMLGPVQMVFILPAIFGGMPGIELTPATALIPVLNVVLAFKAMLVGKVLILEYAITAGALLVYGLIAIHLAVRLLSRESVLLSAKTLSIRRLLALFRSSGSTR